MSIIKIEQDIKLLENELRELDATITDPIEHNEHKKELKKKITKLQRTKSQIEQLEIEQQELESLKSELTANSEELDKSTETKASDKPTLKDTASPKGLARMDGMASRRDKTEIEVEITESIPTISSQSASANATSDSNNKSEIPWIKILLFMVAGLFLTTTASIALIFNHNNTLKVEETRLQEIARRKVIEAEIETEQARKEKQQARAAIEQVERLKQKSLQANNEVEIIQRKSTNNRKAISPRDFIENKYFSNYQFPNASCGDRDPGGANTWYPVFITNTEHNFNEVRDRFCRDAIRKYREDRQLTSIQAASFTNKAKAEEFASILKISLGTGEVGQPKVLSFDSDNLF